MKKRDMRRAAPKRPAPAPKPQTVAFRPWHLALVAALAAACYAQTLGYGFVYDDDVQIVRNPRIRSFANLPVAFSENVWAFNGPQAFTNYYRPLQTATYMAAYALGKLDPRPYHLLAIV